MDKKLRNILILAGILVVLCVGYAVTGILFREETPEETDDARNGAGDTAGAANATN